MKMLLVGDLNETLYSVNDYLVKDFQIQICSDNGENVKDMIRLYRPEIVVLFANEMNAEIQNILLHVSTKYDMLPFLVIGTTDIRSDVELYTEKHKNKKFLCRPVVSSEIRKQCMILLRQESDKDAIRNGTKERKRILIVDDNALVLRNMKSLLEPEYQVVLANSGEKALAAVKKSRIDMVLLDYEMPDMNGREVFEKMLEDEETKDIPVVFLTSIAQRDQIYAVLRNLPFGYILKPPANERIISVIKEAIG